MDKVEHIDDKSNSVETFVMALGLEWSEIEYFKINNVIA